MSHDEPISVGDRDTFRQRTNLNVWDSFALEEFWHQPEINRARGGRDLTLFGSRNIGDLCRTNLQIHGSLVPHDCYAVIHNWYAHSDRDLPAEWQHTTIATLVLGNMPIHQLPLSALLARKEGQRDEAELTEFGITGLAWKLFDRHEAEISKVAGRSPQRWTDLYGWAQAAWISTAQHARGLLRAPVLAVVPPRQNCDVVISSHSPLPDPTARVWIHLEGVQCLDSERRHPCRNDQRSAQE